MFWGLLAELVFSQVCTSLSKGFSLFVLEISNFRFWQGPKPRAPFASGRGDQTGGQQGPRDRPLPPPAAPPPPKSPVSSFADPTKGKRCGRGWTQRGCPGGHLSWGGIPVPSRSSLHSARSLVPAFRPPTPALPAGGDLTTPHDRFDSPRGTPWRAGWWFFSNPFLA